VPRITRWLGAFGWRPLVDVVPGGYQVNLTKPEQRVVMDSMDELRVMLADQDPATRRLFPTAYVEHPELDAEYQRLVGDDLRQGQLDALDVVERTIDGQVIDQAEAEAWMRAVNGVRLALGTRLDVGEEPPEALDADDPDLHDRIAYEVLNMILGAFIATLAT
jgi:hypothetical protein